MRRLIAVLAAAVVATTGLVVGTSATATTVYRTYEGSGDRVVRLNLDAVSLVTTKYTGGSNFAIWGLDKAGRETELLVNHIGPYRGTTVLPASARQPARGLEITASGSWTVTTKPLRKARVWRDAVATTTGAGDNVLKLPVRKQTLKAVYRGRSNFAIWALNRNGQMIDLLVNEIGRYRGTTVMPVGTKYLAISANSGDSWSLTKR